MREHAPQPHEQLLAEPEAAKQQLERHPEIMTHKAKEHLSPTEARTDVAEALAQNEAQRVKQETTTEYAEAPPTRITSNQKRQAFAHTMADIRKDMSPTSRAFSKIIHHPAVEATSEVVGKTIARPTSILYGSFCAFIITLVVYLLAQHKGFRLSGSEFIVLFAIGWVLGLAVDAVRSLFGRQ